MAYNKKKRLNPFGSSLYLSLCHFLNFDMLCNSALQYPFIFDFHATPCYAKLPLQFYCSGHSYYRSSTEAKSYSNFRVYTNIISRGWWEGCEPGCCIQRACWDCPHQMGHTWCACPKEQPPPIFWCRRWVLGRPQWHHHKLWGLLTLSVCYYVIQFLCIVCFVLYNLYSCECTRIIETTCLYQLAPHVKIYALSPSTWDVSLSSYFLKRESAH